MTRVRLRLRMARRRRAGKDRVVGGIAMTRRTDATGISVTRREPGVTERGSCPGCRRVASLAGRREPRGRVVWICRSGVVRCVT